MDLFSQVFFILNPQIHPASAWSSAQLGQVHREIVYVMDEKWWRKYVPKFLKSGSHEKHLPPLLPRISQAWRYIIIMHGNAHGYEGCCEY